MVEQVSFNTRGNDKILVHLTNFSISKLYAVSNIVLMDVRQFFWVKIVICLVKNIYSWNSLTSRSGLCTGHESFKTLS